MPSKRSHEGYLLIDHRAGPGISAEQAARAGLPPGSHCGIFEAPTYTCRHCQRVVVINPLRTRDREYCPGCNHYICDDCGRVRSHTGRCLTFEQAMYEMQLAADRDN